MCHPRAVTARHISSSTPSPACFWERMPNPAASRWLGPVELVSGRRRRMMNRLGDGPREIVYRQLDPLLVIATADRLSRRIGERFPDSDLRRVAAEVHG